IEYLATNQAVGSSNLSGRTITPKQQASACCFFMRVFRQGCALHLQKLQAKATATAKAGILWVGGAVSECGDAASTSM
ncbi:hypothetical protein ABW42_19955, partial [Stenotrophomonas maltophilia]